MQAEQVTGVISEEDYRETVKMVFYEVGKLRRAGISDEAIIERMRLSEGDIKKPKIREFGFDKDRVDEEMRGSLDDYMAGSDADDPSSDTGWSSHGQEDEELMEGVKDIALAGESGKALRTSVEAYLFVAHHVLSLMLSLNAQPIAQVVHLHWRVFCKPAKVYIAVRRAKARRRMFITSLKASDANGFDITDGNVELYFSEPEVLKALCSLDDRGSSFTVSEYMRIENVVPHMYHFVAEVALSEVMVVNEKVPSRPMPDPPLEQVKNEFHQQFAQYFIDNYVMKGVCEPVMFFSVVLSDYILEGRSDVVRAWLNDSSYMFRMYRRCLNNVIQTQPGTDFALIARSYQGLKLSAVSGMQEMKVAVGTKISGSF